MSLSGTIEYSTIANVTESGEIVAAVTNKAIVVTGLIISADAAGTVTFKSDDGSGTALAGILYFAADSSTIFPHRYGGYFATVSGEALFATITTALTINASFTITYRLV